MPLARRAATRTLSAHLCLAAAIAMLAAGCLGDYAGPPISQQDYIRKLEREIRQLEDKHFAAKPEDKPKIEEELRKTREDLEKHKRVPDSTPIPSHPGQPVH